MAEDWWQEIIRERLPADADIRFSDDGGAVSALFGPWAVDSPWGCSWTEIRGPGISRRIVVTGGLSERWNRVIAVLEALGGPIRPGRSFDLGAH